MPVVRANGARRCRSGPNLLSRTGDSSKSPPGFFDSPLQPHLEPKNSAAALFEIPCQYNKTLKSEPLSYLKSPLPFMNHSVEATGLYCTYAT